MTIYRGPGGGGNADSDAEINQLAAFALDAELSANAAAASAVQAAASADASAAAVDASIAAGVSAANALSSANASAASAAAALVAENAAEAAQTAAELAETNAETAQAAAQLAETNAETAETNAAASAVSAASSASTATTQAGLASTSASNASISASNAATSASGASTSASNAASSASSAAASYDSFDDRYLGAKSADPTLDNDGNALLTGALYWNTVSNQMRAYSGSAWIVSYLPADGYVQKTGDTMSGSLSVTGTVTATTFSGAGTSLTGTASALNIGGNAATATTATNQSGGTVSATSISDSGNLTFTGTGNRITGDFSNATIANRVMFQTSTANSVTVVSAIPNGSSTQANFNLHNNSDPTNSSDLRLLINASEARFQASITGTGTYLPMTFYTGGSERVRIDTSGNVGIGTSSPSTRLAVSSSGANGLDLSVDQGNAVASARLFFSNGTAGQAYSISNDTGALKFSRAATAGSTTGTESMRIDSSGNFLFNSGYGSVATAYGCRAWVNFNGTGTVAIRASGNVSSITDNGTGDYTVNFTTAMPDANYAAAMSASTGVRNPGEIQTADYLAGSVRYLVRTGASTTTSVDAVISNCIIFR